jgi:hypothetical protein
LTGTFLVVVAVDEDASFLVAGFFLLQIQK